MKDRLRRAPLCSIGDHSLAHAVPQRVASGSMVVEWK